MCVYYKYVHILEIKLFAGLEQATFTFAASVVAFALSSFFLLKFSGGKKVGNVSCVTEYMTCCRKATTFLIQAVFIFLPRVICLCYFRVSQEYSPDRDSLLSPLKLQDSQSDAKNDGCDSHFLNIVNQLDSGLMDVESYLLLIAIADSISISMFTPWYCFVKRKGTTNNSQQMSRC